MQIGTIPWIILAAVAALAIVVFQYYYPGKKKSSISLIASILRFFTWFAVFVLLINPKFSKNEYELEKTKLVLLTDNSASIHAINQETNINAIVDQITSNSDILDKFDMQQYRFGSTLKFSDSLTFDEKITDIHDALLSIKQAYTNTDVALLLITDGNTTYGEEYRFFTADENFSVFPIVVGDTAKYTDIRIGQVNHNNYAFLNNKYPIEVYVNYDGATAATSTFTITQDRKIVYSENLGLDNTTNFKIINTLLDADAVGIKNLKLNVSALTDEKNVVNNTKNIGIEVIDEKTKIALVSDIIHPDIGALTKAIESNEQRSVTLLNSRVTTENLNDFDIYIFYQPNRRFEKIFSYVQNKKASLFTITGRKTDWNFLNRIQNSYTKNGYGQDEEIVPTLNKGFNTFGIPDFSVTDFPPLASDLGEILITKSHETLLFQQIKGVSLPDPLFAITTGDQPKEAILFGENIWKWRAQSFREHRNFENFDNLIGKLMLYLAANTSRERLLLDYKTLYQGNFNARITATYFDNAYTFDPSALLSIQLKSTTTNAVQEIPFLLKNGYYEVDLSAVAADSYTFTVRVRNKPISASGSFTILDFDVERQFFSSDADKLSQLASNTGGKLYTPDAVSVLIQDLETAERFNPKQKNIENEVPLIDFRILLGFIIACLTAEWFIRKYHGLV